MKRKLSLTFKSLFALYVSLALVLSTAGPASAEVGYAPEKCTGSKYVCEFWSTNDESTDGSWRFFACYKTKVSVKIQIKKGSSWKNVKGASAKGKKSDESCDDKYPYAVSVEVIEKSKGTKSYRLVETEKKTKPYYANFKVKVTKYEFDSSDSDSGSPSPSASPSATKQLDRYVLDKIASAIRVTRNWNSMYLYQDDLRMVPLLHLQNGNTICWMQGQSANLPKSASWVKEQYEKGNISTDAANDYADSILDYWRSCPL